MTAILDHILTALIWGFLALSAACFLWEVGRMIIEEINDNGDL